MLTNADCTIYDGKTCKRREILGVHWEECAGHVRRMTGAQAADSVIVYIPFRAAQTPPEKGDYIVKGVHLQDYGELSNVLKNHKAYCVLSIDTRDYGSADMHHWEVSAK